MKLAPVKLALRLARWIAVAVVSAAAIVAIGACDPPGKTSPRPDKRIDGVAAQPAVSAKPSAKKATPPAPKKARELCKGQSERDPPEKLSDARAASGAAAPPALAYGKKWVWVNVWAAWCEPCKEEMPMLLEWRDKLRKEGVALDLVFVSIDDDERQLDRFLSSQPKGGVRSSYWLGEEKTREEWFASVGFDDTPQLPIHALVNPAGKLGCVIEGAVEASDYASLSSYFGG